MSVEHLKSPEGKHDREVLFWYFNTHLECVSGKQTYTKEVRCDFLPTENMELNGEEKVIIPTTQEAFGLLSLDNNCQKWKNIFEYKKQHGSQASVPKKDKAALPYKGKYSDSKTGRVLYGGWSEAGIKELQRLMDAVGAFRKLKAESDSPIQNYALELMQAKHKKGKKRGSSDASDETSESGGSGSGESTGTDAGSSEPPAKKPRTRTLKRLKE